MERILKDKYDRYIKSLLKYMDENGYTKKPFPKIILNEKKQKDNAHILTGYYDPDSKTITVFTADRHIKDCLRSIAHECVHHKQNMEGRLGDGAYSGNKIIEDDKLVGLEKEAYLNGNIAFRSWTETFKE